MDLTEARRVLGVSAEAPWTEVRNRYHSLMLANHPDHAGSRNTATAAEITSAYALVESHHEHGGGRAAGRPPSPTRPARPVVPSPADWSGWARLPAGSVQVVDSDTLGIDASREEAMLALLEVAHDIGEVSFVDIDLGMLEVIVQFVGTPTCSLVVNLQGRADRVDAFCTVESFDARPAPRIAQVTWLLANELSRAR